MIVSWNFRHIVHLNRIRGYRGVNLLRGYGTASIHSPTEVIERETREKCFISVARAWFQRDGPAAAAWLDESPLDEESRDSVHEWAAERERGPAPARKKARASPRSR